MNKQNKNIIVLVVLGVLIATLKSKASTLYASALNFIKIKVKIESAKSSGDSGSQISMLQSQAERKRKEYSSFVKMKVSNT